MKIPRKKNILGLKTSSRVSKYSTQARRMIQETPELYQRVVKPYIDSFPPSRIQWSVFYHNLAMGEPRIET